MTWKRVGGVMAAAGALTLAISQPLDDQQRLSVRLWLALTAATLGGLLVVALVQRIPIRDGAPRPKWWRRWRRTPEQASRSAVELRAATGVVLRSTENARTHNSQLRPRLTALADHFVPRHTATATDRLDELIAAAGDTGWLLDPTIVDRTPSLAEIDRFLDQILDDPTPTR